MNYFEIFEISPCYKINPDDLQLKYLQLQKKYHPDNAESVDQQLAMVEKTILINEGFDVLSNQAKLIEYYLSEKGIKLSDKQVQENLDQADLLMLLDLQEQFLENPTKLNEYKAIIKAEVEKATDDLIKMLDNNNNNVEKILAKVMFFSKSLKHMG